MKVKQTGWIYLLMGTTLVVLTQLRFGLGFLMWIAPVPFLVYLRQKKGFKRRVVLALVLVTAWSLACLKILTEPIPPIFAVFYGLPLGLIQLMGYLTWGRTKNSPLSIFAFPAAMAITEWIQYTLTPLGSWRAAGYTQLDKSNNRESKDRAL